MATGEISMEQLSLHLERVGSGELAAVAVEQLTTVASALEEQVKENIRGRLTMRSQSLVTSVWGDLVVTPGQIDVKVTAGGNRDGLRVAYARIQEMGGVVVPVRAKFLAIPVGPALTGPGIAKGGPKQVPGLTYAQTRKGQPVLLKASGPNAGQVWFLLRRRVVVSPKHFMRDALAAVAERVPAQLAATATAAVTPRAT